jgi:hypothetical protein
MQPKRQSYNRGLQRQRCKRLQVDGMTIARAARDQFHNFFYKNKYFLGPTPLYIIKLGKHIFILKCGMLFLAL